MEKVKLFKVSNNHLAEITTHELDLEERLHNWIEQDLSVILPNTFLIKSRYRTDHGKEIDILAMDNEGDLVVIELKRGLTPREVVAQALDYVSAVAYYDEEKIDEIVRQEHNRNLEDYFSECLPDFDFPDINENQKIFIVGTNIDPISERIIKYISERGININVATFDYFNDNGNEYIARNFLVEEEVYQRNDKNRSTTYVSRLISNGKLQIGDVVVFQPALDESHTIEDNNFIRAEVVRYGSKILKVEGEDKLFSFSGLRNKIITELNIPNLRPNWGYSQWDEWRLENGEYLSELL